MTETTEIEKKSLEAHVELCAERYRFLENKLESVEEKIEGTNVVVREVRDMVQDIADKHNDRILAWGAGIVGTMVIIIGYLLTTYVMK